MLEFKQCITYNYDMIYQKWLNDPNWELTDPKLRYLPEQPIELPHTQRLVKSIDLSPPGIIIVQGPRQTGKSTFLRQFIKKALLEGIPLQNIGLIEAEMLQSRHDLLGEINSFRTSHDGYAVLLVDEITTIEKWWLSLKIASDEGSLENMLIICTGSSSIDLSVGADMLPGRRGKRYPLDFELLPVRYADVHKHLSLEEFFLTGGFPWSINEYLKCKSIPPYVYELYRAWIQGALLKKNHDLANLSSLLTYTAKRIGTGLSVTNLARDCGIGSNHTAEAYLSALDLNYILMVSHWSEPGCSTVSPRKNRKFFPSDPFLFHLFHDFNVPPTLAYSNSLDRCADAPTLGALAECVVASELRHFNSSYPLRYFLGKKEIDFIGKEAVFEVKYQNTVSINEFDWIDKVLPPKIPFTVITKNTTSRNGRIRAVPLYDWLLEDKS